MNNAPQKEIPAPNAPVLPATESATDLVERLRTGSLSTPPPIVHGVLHEGDIGMIAGPSKSRKTWLQLHLGLCVANGQPWWDFPTTQSRVLFLNLEVNRGFFASRIDWISKTTGLSCDGLDVMNLRGIPCEISKIAPELINRARGGGYKLIILDPIYKVAGGRTENANEDAAELLSFIETIAGQTGAALLFGHHFAKGLASSKDAIDRASGAGVFARHPDAIITLTPHEENEAFTCEMILRNCKPVPSFAVGWDAPLITRRDDLNPADLRQAGRKKEHPPEAVRQFATEPMIRAELQRRVSQGLGCSIETAKRRVEDALTKGIVVYQEGSKMLVAGKSSGSGAVTVNFNDVLKAMPSAPTILLNAAANGSKGSKGSELILTQQPNDPKEMGQMGHTPLGVTH